MQCGGPLHTRKSLEVVGEYMAIITTFVELLNVDSTYSHATFLEALSACGPNPVSSKLRPTYAYKIAIIYPTRIDNAFNSAGVRLKGHGYRATRHGHSPFSREIEWDIAEVAIYGAWVVNGFEL